MSSIASSGVADFSGLGVGWVDGARGALLKKEVMGLYIGLGFPGDLAGDLWVDADIDLEAPRVPLVTAGSVPRALGRLRGGVFGSSASDSDESTTGFFRAAAALGLPIRPRDN